MIGAAKLQDYILYNIDAARKLILHLHHDISVLVLLIDENINYIIIVNVIPNDQVESFSHYTVISCKLGSDGATYGLSCQRLINSYACRLYTVSSGVPTAIL